MKKTVFLFIFLFTGLSLFSREAQGYYIDLMNDTFNVRFNIPITDKNEPYIQYLHFGVKFLDKNNVPREMKPHQAKEIRFVYNNKTTRLIAHADYLNLGQKMFKSRKTYIFLKLEVKGKLKLFSYYHTQHVSMDFSFQSKMMIFQKGNDLLFIPSNMRFRRSMKKYLKDCPEVVKRLKLKLYGKGDEIEIAKAYNEKCVNRA